jgi:hypothetical protein
VSGSTVYVGGQFTTIGSQGRNYLAAIDSGNSCLTSYNPTSCLQPWNPHANNWVLALAVNGTTVYAGGLFTSIGGQMRNKLAAIGTNGSVQDWNPNANGQVYDIFVSGTTIYVGGDFTCFGNCISGTEGVDKWTRNRLAAIDVGNSCLTAFSPSCLQPWNPNANSTVFALAVSGSTVYAGGDFTSIGGTARNRLAAIGTDGSLQSWNPNANNYVYALAVSGSTVYAGGAFTTIGGIPRNRIVSINADGSVNW